MSRPRVPLPRLNKRPLVVASLGDYAHILKDVESAKSAGADILEIRADCFPRNALHPEILRRLLQDVKKRARLPLIFTLRARSEGGRLPRIGERDRLEIYRAALSSADVIDVELSSNDINRHLVFEAHKRGRAVILSHHDFNKIPSESVLKGLAQKAGKMKGDIFKVAGAPQNKSEVARMMDFCRNVKMKYRVFLPMGPLGRLSRKEGYLNGSCLTYGYVRKSLAPGQIRVSALAQFLRGKKLVLK